MPGRSRDGPAARAPEPTSRGTAGATPVGRSGRVGLPLPSASGWPCPHDRSPALRIRDPRRKSHRGRARTGPGGPVKFQGPYPRLPEPPGQLEGEEFTLGQSRPSRRQLNLVTALLEHRPPSGRADDRFLGAPEHSQRAGPGGTCPQLRVGINRGAEPFIPGPVDRLLRSARGEGQQALQGAYRVWRTSAAPQVGTVVRDCRRGARRWCERLRHSTEAVEEVEHPRDGELLAFGQRTGHRLTGDVLRLRVPTLPP